MKVGPGVGGVRMAFLGAALTLAVLMVGSVLAGTFASEPLPFTYEAATAPNISFNVTNTDPLYNITNITVIFPSTIEFVTGSSYTSMSDFIISNTTSSFMWGNNTPQGILPNGSSTYLNLSFHNMTAPGNYSFELNMTFADDSYGNETHNVTIADTIPPYYQNDQDNSSSPVESGDTVAVSVYWDDIVELGYAISRTNETSGWDNRSYHEFSTKPEYSNFSIDTTGQPSETICWVVWVNDTSGNINSSMSISEHCFYVTDTISPAGIVPIAAECPANDSWINTSSVYINFSFTELNPDTCLYDNLTANQSESPSGNNCSFSVTGYGEGNWTYRVWVNDTSGNLNVSDNYTLGYDTSDPVGNSLGLFYQGANVSNGSITELDGINISVNVTDLHSGVNTTLDDAVYANITKSGSVVAIVNLTHTSGDIFNGTWDVAQNNSGDGNYSINITATDIAGNGQDSLISTTLEILGAPDLTVTGVEWTSSNNNPGWPTSSDDITLNITIMNTGDGNFTGTFNVTTDVDDDDVYGSDEDLSTLSYLNESESVTLNLTLTSGNFSTNKYYTFAIELDPENVVNESAETNNTYTLGFNLGYNISLVTFNATDWPSVGKAFPDKNVTVNISVTGGNGTGVADLGQNDLSFWNRYDGWQSSNLNVSDRIYGFGSGGGDGYYVFTFSTEEPDPTQNGNNRTRARFGDNYLNVTAISGSYSGMSLLLYNITAPDLEISIDDDEIDEINLAGASYKEADFNFTLTNNGNARIEHIYIEDDDTSNWVMPFDDFTIDHSDVNNLALDPGESYLVEAELRVEETHSYEYNLFLFVYGNDSVDNRYKGFAREKVEVIDTGSGGDDDDDDDDGGTTGGGDLELELTLTDWEDEIDGYPGDSNTTRVDVKNTGDVTVVAKVSFTCDPIEDDPTIGPISKSLAVGTSQEFIIDFNIGDDAEIGEYDCTVKAYISSSEDDYDTETIVLRILATEEVAEEINCSCQNLSAAIEGLFGRFSMINKALVNDTNLTRVENLLNTANITLQDIWNAIGDGDYITAHELIESLNASLGSIESGLDDLELEQTLGGGVALSGTWFWAVIIIVVVIAVAFVAYLLFPQKGHGPGKSITDTLRDTIRMGASSVGEIKDKGKALGSGKKEPFRPSGYSGGYEKQAPSSYGYRKGPAGKVKDALGRLKDKLKRKKKPQKEVTQYFTNPSSNIINYS